MRRLVRVARVVAEEDIALFAAAVARRVRILDGRES